jgi:hypothetical protein
MGFVDALGSVATMVRLVIFASFYLPPPTSKTLDWMK